MRRAVSALEPLLIKAYRKLSDPPTPNLRGDRDVEYSWIMGKLPDGPGRGLEFGSGNSYLALAAVRRGFTMTSIDLLAIDWWYRHPQLQFVQTDVFDFQAEPESLDLVINCSAVEHVGLGRYGGALAQRGDLDAMQRMRTLLRPGGQMLLTIPVGRDTVVGELHRVYGAERLPKLLEGFTVADEEYWLKNKRNRWVVVARDQALQRPPSQHCYGLGCFRLVRSA